MVFPCPYCKNEYASAGGMRTHRQKHPEWEQDKLLKKFSTQTTGNKKCGLCPENASRYGNMQSLLAHLRENHDQKEAKIDTKTFANQPEFDEWMAEKSKEGCFTFTRSWGDKKNTGYKCHRSGSYNVKDNPERAPKQQATIKMGYECSCFVTVTKNKDDTLTASYCLHHYGHNFSAALIRIAKDLEQDVANMVMDKRDTNYIIQKLQEKMMGETQVQREHLITDMDIRNIEKRRGLKLSLKDVNDKASVALWVKEYQSKLEDKSPFFYHTDNGKIFTFAIQTTEQVEKLILFGHFIIFIDSTHNTTGYNLKLVNIMIRNNDGKGMPVAHLITDHEIDETLTGFWVALKARVGNIQPKFFMSDRQENYWTSFTKVFDASNTRRLLCSWHTQKNWRKNMIEKLNDSKNVPMIAAMLSHMMQCSDPNDFQLTAAQLMTHLQETKELSFREYLQNYYLCDPETQRMWAYCYRRSCPFNTNNLVESFHRVLKVCLMKGKCNKRTDSLIEIVLNGIDIYVLKDGQTAEKLLVRNNKAMGDTHSNHRTYVKDILPKYEKGEISVTDSTNGWNVQSTTNKDIFYTISKESECDCLSKCRMCKVCSCNYSCTCPDAVIHNNVCKHIHFIHEKYGKEKSPEPEMPVKSQSKLIRPLKEPEMDRAKVESLISKISSKFSQVDDPEKWKKAFDKLLNCDHFLDTCIEGTSATNFELETERNFRSNTDLEKQRRDFEKRSDAKRKRNNNQNYIEIRKAAKVQLNEYTSEKLEVCSYCFVGNDDGNREQIDWFGCDGRNGNCPLWYHKECILEMQEDPQLNVHWNGEELICPTCLDADF